MLCIDLLFVCLLVFLAIVSVQSYFEKVSEEMELIVNQVKNKESEKVLTDGKIPSVGTCVYRLYLCLSLL